LNPIKELVKEETKQKEEEIV